MKVPMTFLGQLPYQLVLLFYQVTLLLPLTHIPTPTLTLALTLTPDPTPTPNPNPNPQPYP